MKALWSILGLAAAVGLAACEPLDDIDLGGGGTAGTAFSRGFIFIRGDGTARNVYALDDLGDPNSPLQLTTQGGAYHPAVSRNGLVAFVYKAGNTVELRTVPSTGQGLPSTLVTSTSTGCTGCNDFRYPTFSPDGRTIVFTVYGGSGGAGRLARVNTDASGFSFLTDTTYVYGPVTFMPDGKSVLAAGGYSANSLNFLINVNAASGTATPISTSLGNTAQVVLSRVTVSPDGTKVAFDAQTSSGSRVFVGEIGQQLSNVTQVTEKAGAADTYPNWRGNTELGFLSNDGGSDNVYRIRADSVRGSGALSLLVPVAKEPAYGGSL